MCNLGSFLASDVQGRTSSFTEWLFDDKYTDTCSNATALEKENGFILIRDMYSEEEEPTQLKLSYAQFLQILDEWEEKVIKLKPQEVIIWYKNNQFVFETKMQLPILNKHLLEADRKNIIKTHFPQNWSEQKIFDAIIQAYDNFQKSGTRLRFMPDDKYHAIGVTQEGLKIGMYITKNGELKIAYPIMNYGI
jgi:hypothetical protein